MASNILQEEGNHVVSIPEVMNTEQLACDMKEEIERCTKGLRSNAARSTCYMYKVPLKFEENNGKNWYSPRIVSIGPYYYDDKDLYRDYKYQCLGSFLSRTRVKGIGLEDYLKMLHPLETKARECYSGKFILDSGEFLEMMVLDACFILELFYKFQDPGRLKNDDPLAPLKSRLPYFYVDLLLLENQIPFFVLQQLFNISKLPGDPSLPLLALRFFNNIMRRPNETITRNAKYPYNNTSNGFFHLLDLVRFSLIPNDLTIEHEFFGCFSTPSKKDDTQIQFIPCISKLRRSGIRVRPGKAESFLLVKFEQGVVEMPSITINDFMRSLLLNCLAFEQCHERMSNKYVTVYATFLDCLVNTTEDVQYLRDCNVIDNVIDNSLADDDKVALFINSLGKGLNFGMRDFYLSKLFNDVDKYHRSRFNVQCASFKHKYLNSPWSCISVLAATVLLLLTLAQTYFAIIGYVHPKK